MGLLSASGFGQSAGGQVYNGNQGNPADILRQQRQLSAQEVPPTLNSTFLDASVLINVHADAYVAVFGVSEEGKTLSEAREKVRTKIDSLKAAVRKLGLSTGEPSTDFVAQNRVYGYEVTGNIATEKVVGFELKENVSVQCRSQAQVDQLIATAATQEVFDLIKVDYILSDVSAMRPKLLAEAAKVINQKKADYQSLFGIDLRPSPQIYIDHASFFYPTEMYASYQAAEGDEVDPGFNRQNYFIHGARKMRTFYYNPLSGKGFDRVVNPIVTDPVVQCTLYLKLRFESGEHRRPTQAAKE